MIIKNVDKKALAEVYAYLNFVGPRYLKKIPKEFIELIRGKPLPPEKEAIVHLIGFALLLILMVFILYNDIRNVFFVMFPKFGNLLGFL